MGSELEHALRAWPTGARARLEVAASPGLRGMVGEPGIRTVIGALGGLGVLIEDPEVLDRLAEAVATPGEAETIEARLRRVDGSMRWVAITVCRSSDDDGGFVTVVDLEDISDRRLAEALIAEGTVDQAVTDVARPAVGAQPLVAAVTPADVRRGSEAGELRALFQPQVCLLTRAVVGFEALAAWEHPSRGLLRAASFVDAASAAGVIDDVLGVVLDEAVLVIQRLVARGTPAQVSVNLAPEQLCGAHVATLVQQRLSDRGLDPTLLALEVPVSVFSEISPAIREGLVSLRAVGVSIFVDKFGGAGHPMVSWEQLPIDGIKLARSVVADLTRSDVVTATVREVVAAARSRGLRVIANGVETPEASRLLRSLGCEEGQGFLFARPMSLDSLPIWMARTVPVDSRAGPGTPVTAGRAS